jgi:hypothetical protein
MNIVKISQKYHKWLMLFLGIQFVIWSITGVYMVFIDIDYIHGDSLVKSHQLRINPENINYSLAQLIEDYPDAMDISLGKFVMADVYRFTRQRNSYLIDASSGKLLSPLSKKQITDAARFYYAGQADVINIELISDNPPFELNQRYLPAWRVDFDHYSLPTLYISAQHGRLVGKRHQFWRLFDWMFRFHIMDYGDEATSSNVLLLIITVLSILGCFTGLVLMYVKVIRVYTLGLFRRGRAN